MVYVISIVLLVLAKLLVVVTADTYYVTPMPSIPCPEKYEPCFTLSQYASKTSFTTNSEFVFLPGNHRLKTDLVVKYILTLNIVVHSEKASIACIEGAKFVFEGVSIVSMKGLKLQGCMNNKIISVDNFTLEDCSFQGHSNQIGRGIELDMITNGAIARSSFSWFNGNSSANIADIRLFGAVYISNSENVTISKCAFLNNTVTGNNGGGAAVFGLFTRMITVKDSIFMDNILYGDKQTGGGAIGVGYSAITVYRSSFIGNTVFCNSGLGGGAITGVFSTILLYSCNFSGNSVIEDNDILQRDETIQSSDLGPDDSIISSPTTNGGGALYLLFGSITVSECLFFNNLVAGYSDQYYGGGGAMFVSNGTLSITKCIFIENTATGISVAGGGLLATSSSVDIHESSFNNNVVTGNLSMGGALLVSSLTVDIMTILDTCNFTNNVVTGNEAIGGAVIILGGSFLVKNSMFSSNVVSANYSAMGGAVSVLVTSNVSIEETKLSHNVIVTAKFAMGAAVQLIGQNIILEESKSSIVITRCLFSNNTINEAQSKQPYNNKLHFYDTGPFDSLLSNEKASDPLAGGGAVAVYYSKAVIVVNCTFTDNAVLGHTFLNKTAAGALFIYSSVHVVVNSSNFIRNSVTGASASCGGACFLDSVVLVSESLFINNTVHSTSEAALKEVFGGAITIRTSAGYFGGCIFVNNHVLSHSDGILGFGGAIYATLNFSPLVFTGCNFTDNSVNSNTGSGGAIYVRSNSTVRVSIYGSFFVRNKVNGIDSGSGGAISLTQCNTTLSLNTYSQNSVAAYNGHGGAVYQFSGELNVDNCTFINNDVSGAGEGAALHLNAVQFNASGFIDIENNTAKTGTLYLIECDSYLSGNIDIINNNGSLFVFSGLVSFEATIVLSINNSQSKEGGAIALIQTTAAFLGKIILANNLAEHGGAIFATDSFTAFIGELSISKNRALVSGGGIYTYKSNMYISGSMDISSNRADVRGGGIHAIGSTLRLLNSSKLFLQKNHAEKGGGGCLELNTQIYITKQIVECVGNFSIICEDTEREINPEGEIADCSSYTVCLNHPDSWIRLQFTENSAKYGGALYIGDETYSAGACYGNPFKDVLTNDPSECFMQTLGVYSKETLLKLTAADTAIWNITKTILHSMNERNTYFINNSATEAGNIIYGGLLDRCTVSPIADIFRKYSFLKFVNGISYILSITDISLQDFNSTEMISSDPVRVCFCDDSKPDCSFHPQPKYVNKGAQFRVSLVAVDQINNTIPNTIIHASVSLPATLGKGQTTQQTNIDGKCTQLTYSIFSQNSSEALYLYAEGPCAGIGISTKSINVSIAPCPVGFIDANTSCECDPDIYPEYIVDCFIDSESVLRRDTAWFTFVNDTDFQGYVLHHHCPFDYCLPPSEHTLVNLTDPNGADVICALNRSRILCGSCKDGLSQTFGGSRCLKCSNNMLSLLIVFAIAGIALVAFLLLCNFTVAVGTINSLIFYANIFAANRAIFSPFEPNALIIFIAWLNLDFGFESCFYDGMDTYNKTWLQLAFPLYVITLVILIIVISDYLQKFAALFHGRNPIATLATLILLSYTKLLRIIITSLSSAKLQYSDGTYNTVWLADGNVPYFSGKHVLLFIPALMIVMVGVIFTSLVFCWQWLVYCSNRDPWKRIVRNPKVFAFIDAYHNPFNKQHRYWIGLLLFVRVVLYLVSIINVLGDPRINLLSINSTVVVLLFLRHAVGYKHKIHKTWLTSMLESISFANLIGLSSVTFYITENTDSQALVTTISTAVCFTTFFAMMVYHAYHFVLKRPCTNAKNLLVRMYYGCPNHTEPSCSDIPLTCEEDFGHPTETGFDALPVALDTDEVVSESDHDTLKYSSQKECETLSTVSTNGDTPSVDFNETPNEDCIVQPVKDTVPPTTSPTVEIEMQSLASRTRENTSVALFEETKHVIPQ